MRVRMRKMKVLDREKERGEDIKKERCPYRVCTIKVRINKWW